MINHTAYVKDLSFSRPTVELWLVHEKTIGIADIQGVHISKVSPPPPTPHQQIWVVGV